GGSLCTRPIDFRKGIVSLAALVEGNLDRNPFSSQLFVFTNRHRNKVKILHWERNGFCLWKKRLEQEKFHWCRGSEGVLTINSQQLNWLLDGLDISWMDGHKKIDYSFVSKY
ncbi:MAG: IS66 family insertion sequence element accessory protein TnpB, partial [Magnetococcales bacterium]|nr:IS66 family insertion sequence element accessory protein TnpB [Magnetococcales bacterium]